MLHLAPDEESRLADVLQGGLPLPVTQVTEAVTIEPGHVYVIPPNKNLLAADGRLVLEPIEEERVRRRPVDHFFRTLAYAYGERAVGVVLSGTGANGTVGVRALKEAGGLILAQDPADAAFDEMPRTAIAPASSTPSARPGRSRLRSPPTPTSSAASTCPTRPGRSPATGRRRSRACSPSSAPGPATTLPTTSARPSCAGSTAGST